MPPGILQAIEQLRESWGRLPRQAQIIIPIVALLILGAFLALSFWSRQEEEVLLLSELSKRDASLIRVELSQSGTKHRLTSDGSLYVPRNNADAVRMILSMQNLPQASDSWDVFSAPNIGDTFLDYNRKDQQRMEISIRNSIEWLEPVKFAKVDITPMVDSPFAIDKEPAKASIVLQLKPSRSLGPRQVEGIMNLVSGAVRGLKPENVIITDDQGNILRTAPEESEANKIAQEASWQFEYEQKIANELERKIKQSLAPLVGSLDHVQAIVRVEGNFNKIDSSEVLYNPSQLELTEIPVGSETSVSETTKGPQSEGLPPGTASNVATSASLDLDGNAIEVTRNNRDVQNLVSQRNTTTKRSPVEIKRLTATVLIDQKKKFSSESKEIEFVDWTAEEKQELEEVLKNAVGYDSARGDTVNVVTLAFDRTSESRREAEIQSAKRNDVLLRIASYIVIVVIGLILLFLMRSALNSLRVGDLLPLGGGVAAPRQAPAPPRGRARPRMRVSEGMPLSAPDSDLEAIRRPRGPAAPVFAEAPDVESLETPEMQEMDRLQKEVLGLVQEDPDTVTTIVRNWLSE